MPAEDEENVWVPDALLKLKTASPLPDRIILPEGPTDKLPEQFTTIVCEETVPLFISIIPLPETDISPPTVSVALLLDVPELLGENTPEPDKEILPETVTEGTTDAPSL